MNTLPATLSPQAATMTSREIAELTGKRHDHVMVDIRNMLAQLELNAPEFSGTYISPRGNTYECFVLPKDLTITLVSGYSVVMRHRIVTRWQELETRAAPAIPHDYASALRLAADNHEKAQAALAAVETQKALVIAMKPAADLGNMVCEKDESLHLFMRALPGASGHP